MLIRTGQSGITLIEILIAMVVMSILLSMGVPSFRGWMQNSQVRTAAESVQNGLQLARAEAVNRNTPVSFTLNGNDWSVDVVANATFNTPASNVQQRFGTEGSRNAVITSNQNVVTFNGTGRVTPPAAGDITFAVTNPKAGACAAVGTGNGVRCMNVILQPGGKVRMCDPALLQANNPQGC